MKHYLVVAFWMVIFGVVGQNYEDLRNQMVENQLEGRDISDRAVLDAMRKVKRHCFVPERAKHLAYNDHPLDIGFEQTISQPYIVAYMTSQLNLKPGHRVLEIGTGSGYQAAVLSEITKEVYSIEIVEKLGLRARNVLDSLGYENVRTRIGDGYQGWPEYAPFDAIIITAGVEKVPQPLLDQLAEGGRMIVPIGPKHSTRQLTLIKKKNGKLKRKPRMPVLFVEFTRNN